MDVTGSFDATDDAIERSVSECRVSMTEQGEVRMVVKGQSII